MAKKRKKEPITIADVGSYTSVAKMIGVNPDTLRSAVRFGHLAAHTLGDGKTPVVVIEEARAWAASDRKPGRPAKDS